MSDQNPGDDEKRRTPTNIPLLRGTVTAEDQARIDEEKRRQAREITDDAFKERQVAATEASNNLARKNIYLTRATIVVASVACVATMYQGHLNRKSWETAQGTLSQMKTASEESSHRFQVQLQHFDAGLGRTDVLAQHAGEQAIQTADLAKSSGKQVQYAKQGLIDAKEASRLEESPWVSLLTIDAETLLDGNERYDVLLQNAGKTPAFEVHAFASLITIPASDRPPTFIFQESAAKGSTTFLPNTPQPYRIPIQRPGEPQSVDLFKRGVNHAYIGTELWYRDYWGVPHHDRFCQYFQPESRRWVARKPDHCEN